MTNFNYTDSKAGTQTKMFNTLSEIIAHIENFGWNGDSEGVIFQNEDPIFEYVSRENRLTWRKVAA
jgi:hypothetical protein